MRSIHGDLWCVSEDRALLLPWAPHVVLGVNGESCGSPLEGQEHIWGGAGQRCVEDKQTHHASSGLLGAPRVFVPAWVSSAHKGVIRRV